MDILKHFFNGTLLTDWGVTVIAVTLFAVCGVLLLSW